MIGLLFPGMSAAARRVVLCEPALLAAVTSRVLSNSADHCEVGLLLGKRAVGNTRDVILHCTATPLSSAESEDAGSATASLSDADVSLSVARGHEAHGAAGTRDAAASSVAKQARPAGWA